MTHARPKAWMSWSSGKDSTFGLHVVRSAGDVEVVALVTTVNTTADRVAMHAVRRVLLEAQADAVGLPVHVVELPSPCPNEVYEQRMSNIVRAAADAGVAHMVFGDLFLADIRAYREQQLAGTGLSPMFPLWQRPTDVLAREMLSAGIRAVVTCIDPSQAPPGLAGRWFRRELPRPAASGDRPVRGELRVSHVRRGRTRVPLPSGCRGGGGRGTGRVRVRRRGPDVS